MKYEAGRNVVRVRIDIRKLELDQSWYVMDVEINVCRQVGVAMEFLVSVGDARLVF